MASPMNVRQFKRDPLQSAALEYADRGWRVFPCMPLSKRPLVKDWPAVATCETDTIRRWWTETPQANIAVLCGQASGLLIFDFDGAEGLATYERLRAEFDLKGTLVRTPSGGLHVYLKHPGVPISRQIRAMPGLDVLGENSFAVAPPSRIIYDKPNGAKYARTGGSYSW